MNAPVTDWGRNYPAPLRTHVHADCGLSARTPVVITIVEKMNELLDYLYGDEALPLPVPGQMNIDERMPLLFLRPCAIWLEEIIIKHQWDIDPPTQLKDSMDYHFFVPWVREIETCINDVLRELS